MKYFVFLILTIAISSCHTEITEIVVKIPLEQEPYPITIPDHFPAYPATENPPTVLGVALGKKLFYDPILSGNNQVACASCHSQARAFTDGLSLSKVGVAGTKLKRHSPTLTNIAWVTNGLFWDGGSTNLESQAFGPLAAHDEMFQDLFELEEELLADAEYVRMFQEAFGEVSTANMVKAIAQFERILISANSKYDQYLQGQASLTSSEFKGMQLVEKHCQSCHTGALFTDQAYHNNGIDQSFTNHDHDGIYLGRFRVTRDSSDIGAYKTPTLRNIMVSAPYMHDGRFQNIMDVLNHYDGQMKSSPYTDSLFYDSKQLEGIPLTAAEKDQIVNFLHTLTDSEFLTDSSLQPE